MKTKLKALDLHTPADSDDVTAALSILCETLDEEQQRINNEVSEAARAVDYKTAKSAIKFAEDLLAFKGKVEALIAQWGKLEMRRDSATPEVQAIVSRKFFGRRKRGELTPQRCYFRPILEALVEMGGSGDSKQVIARVGEKMKGVLKPQDYECRKSKGNPIVWVNNTQWARDEMAKRDGRMKPKRKTGIWEIADKGRKWLKEKADK